MMSKLISFLLEKMPNEENAVQFFLSLLAHLGFWPVRRTKPRKGWQLVIHAWNLLMVFLGTLVWGILCPVTIYLNWGVDLMITVETTGGMFVIGMVLVHVGSFLLLGERFQCMVTALEVMTALGKQHCDRPKEVVAVGRRLSRLVGVYYAAVVPAIIVIALVGLPAYCAMKREFIIRIWFPYNFKASPYFELTVLTFLGLLSYGFHLVVVVNALLMSIMTQTTFQLALLSHNIVSLVPQGTLTLQTQPPATLERRIGKGLEVVVVAPGKRRPEQQVAPAKRRPERQKVLGKRRPNHQVLVLGQGKTFIRLSAGQQKASVTLVGGYSKKIATKITKGPLRSRQQEVESRLRFCVKHHQSITSFVDKIRSAFGAILLFQFSCVVFPVVLAIILILFGDVIDWKTYFIVTLVTVAMAQQWLICFVAERIVDESSLVRDAMFGCDWLDQSDAFKRSMRIIMSRSNQPLIVRMLGIPLTMETFQGVLKLTYTYYMSLSASLQPNRRHAARWQH